MHKIFKIFTNKIIKKTKTSTLGKLIYKQNQILLNLSEEMNIYYIDFAMIHVYACI